MEKSTANHKDEPKFVPGWLKATSNGGSTGFANSIHHSTSSSQPIENIGAILARNRGSSSYFNHDDPRSSSRSSSSFHRSSSSNASLNYDRNGNYSRGYNGRDKERDHGPRDRDRTFLLGNFDSLSVSKYEKDNLRRSRSSLSEKQNDLFPRRSSSGIRSKSSFESEFPSLGSDEKQGPSEVVRISSPGLNSSVQILNIGISPIISEGWSALVEVPAGISGSRPVSSSGLPAVLLTPSPPSPASTSVLNMAETVAQAVTRNQTVPQLSSESQRIEELNRRQCVKLIPVTPSTPKNIASSTSSDKSKLKGSTGCELVAASPSGNFQVLNREMNGVSPTSAITKDGRHTTLDLRSFGAIDPIFKTDGNKSHAPRTFLSSFAEKKTNSNAKERNDFFNTLRKKMAPSNNEGGGTDLLASATNSETNSSSPHSDRFAENGNRIDAEGKHASSSDVVDIVDPEEKAFLESLGWNENGEAAALTASEVAEFMEENRERMPSSKLDHLQRIASNAFGLNS